MTPRVSKIVSVALLIAAWAFDLLTPQSFVAAILLNAPIALSSFALDRRFTARLVVAALVANITAGYVNGAQEGFHWDVIAIANRVIVAFSMLLVGVLTVAAQEAGLRAGELVARQTQIARESGLRRAIEAIRSSLNVEVVYRTIVRQARSLFDAEGAALYLLAAEGARPVTLRYWKGDADILEFVEERPPELSSLITRASEERDVVRLAQDNALGRLALDTLHATSAMIVPIIDRDTLFAVLLLERKGDRAPYDELEADAMRAFAEQCGLALAQARLFVQLAEKNEEFARANAALSERTNVIRDIVYAISHDIRTPLAAAQMTMRQALDGAYGPLPEAYRDILRRTIDANAELSRLAETLLLVARYESGEQARNRSVVALAAIADAVVAELRPLWELRGLTLEVVSDGSPMVLADESELRRAATNLIANAITYTPQGGHVVISVQAQGNDALLSVEDDGYGVPEALRASLFERFPSDARRGGGSGLGLYLVSRIAESHGGSVTYLPRDPHGSIFRLRFPLTVGTMEPARG